MCKLSLWKSIWGSMYFFFFTLILYSICLVQICFSVYFSLFTPKEWKWNVATCSKGEGHVVAWPFDSLKCYVIESTNRRQTKIFCQQNTIIFLYKRITFLILLTFLGKWTCHKTHGKTVCANRWRNTYSEKHRAEHIYSSQISRQINKPVKMLQIS